MEINSVKKATRGSDTFAYTIPNSRNPFEQSLCFLRCLNKAVLPGPVARTFYLSLPHTYFSVCVWERGEGVYVCASPSYTGRLLANRDYA